MDKLEELSDKVRSCQICKFHQKNHIVRTKLKKSKQLPPPPLNKKGSKKHADKGDKGGDEGDGGSSCGDMGLSRKDFIEQIIFDPENGVMKREIHFGIVNYLEVRILFKLQYC